MAERVRITDEDYRKLALKIKDEIFAPVNQLKTTIFLCGADIHNNDSIRGKIVSALAKKKYAFSYDIIYPEDIFDELLYNHQGNDLLSLENLLAENVDAVVIVPESPGSFTELGAFANNIELRKKVLCLIEKRFKKKKSFINQGPLKLIKKSNKHGVRFIDVDKLDKELDDLRPILKRFKQESWKENGKRISLLQLDNFLLPAIYLLEPIYRDSLVKLVGYATEDTVNAFQTTVAALTTMTKKRLVELTGEGYKLTLLGGQTFRQLKEQKERNKKLSENILVDKLRLEILNWSLRNKKLSI